MGWWMIASAAISAYSSYTKNKDQTETNKEQSAWNKYNAMMNYSNTMNNLNARMALYEMNAAMTMAAAENTSATTKLIANYNADLLYDAAQYNDKLYEQELQNLWDETGLDLELITLERAKERGEIEAKQSASGTVMGIDSNADVIIDQKTQEALDKFVVRHGADVTAARINNARAKGLWQAEQEIGKVMFEGTIKANTALSNAALASAGMMTEAGIEYAAGSASAAAQLKSGLAGADLTQSQNQTNIDSAFQSGMFSAIGSGISSYLNNSDVDTSSLSTDTSTNSSFDNSGYSYSWNSDYTSQSFSEFDTVDTTDGGYWGSAGTSLLR